MKKTLVLTATLLWAGPVLAQEEMAYRRTVVPGRPLCLLWPGRDYVYHLDPAGSERTPGRSEVDAIEASFASWRTLSATCSDYAFRRGEDVEGVAHEAEGVGVKAHPEVQAVLLDPLVALAVAAGRALAAEAPAVLNEGDAEAGPLVGGVGQPERRGDAGHAPAEDEDADGRAHRWVSS